MLKAQNLTGQHTISWETCWSLSILNQIVPPVLWPVTSQILYTRGTGAEGHSFLTHDLQFLNPDLTVNVSPEAVYKARWNVQKKGRN